MVAKREWRENFFLVWIVLFNGGKREWRGIIHLTEDVTTMCSGDVCTLGARTVARMSRPSLTSLICPPQYPLWGKIGALCNSLGC